jgi:formyltetrahydrofolate hydrolase
MYKLHLKERNAQSQNQSANQSPSAVNQSQFAVNQNQLVVNQNQFAVNQSQFAVRQSQFAVTKKKIAMLQCTMNLKIAYTKYKLMLNKIKTHNSKTIMMLISKFLKDLKHILILINFWNLNLITLMIVILLKLLSNALKNVQMLL